MVLDLKFSRFEDAPWGFRLTGGADFEMPLTVIKVTKGSIAEEAGLKVGDVFVRVNDTPTSNLDHKEAHELIMKCGNNFLIGVIRPDEDGGEPLPEDIASMENGLTNGNGYLDIKQQSYTPDSQAYSEMSEISMHTNKTDPSEEPQNESEEKAEITDDHIAEIISGEAEVLKEHNVIGVNFQKIMPKASIFKSSEVFKHLNAEAMKTRADKEQETKRWTTFLQKPDRPIPKSKAQLEHERRQALAYRVVIHKQPKPKCAPGRTPTPPPIEKPIEIIPPPAEPEPELSSDIPTTADAEVNEDLNETIGDSEVPNLEQTENKTEIDENNSAENEDTNTTTNQNENDSSAVMIEEVNEPKQKTEEELLIEKQLADVQKQLLALSSLPLTIQATLDAVTKQLADIMPTMKLQSPINNGIQSKSDGIEIADEEKERNDIVEESTKNDEEMLTENSTQEQQDDMEAQTKENDNQQTVEAINNENVIDSTIEQQSINIVEKKPLITEIELTPEEQIDKQKAEKVFRKQEEEWLNKREKEQKRLDAELKQQLPKRLSKANGGPLTPKDRPLVLPGGRKWRNERDAFNEDFIAEVISSQAELIVGSTLGHTYESPLLGYDERQMRQSNCYLIDKTSIEDGINFLKYKKPEKDLSNLKSSEVFKIIHHLEKEPKHGIQVRPAKVAAEEDIRNSSTPISCV